MKKIFTLLFLSFLSLAVFSGTVEKTFHIAKCDVSNVGSYQTLIIDNAKLSGIPGEPTLPYLAVSLMLPPGETAASIEIIRTNEVILQGTFTLFPKQDILPLSKKPSGEFLKKLSVYTMNAEYPSSPEGHLLTQYLNGYTFALSTFTPVSYNPATGKVSYFRDITVRILTRPDTQSSTTLKNLTTSKDALERVRSFAQNPEMMGLYPAATKKKAGYQILIITPFAFEDGFTDLINYYATRGLTAQIESTEDINSGISGADQQEKIRNYITQEYQNNQIEYVLLGGSEQWVPSRKFYCIVNFSTGGVEEEAYDIPADIYYSALDGTDDLNGNLIYGEVADSTDLLPDVAVGRLPYITQAEQVAMVHKSVSYQENPVLGEADRPLFAGEYLWPDPITFGGQYMDLLADNHSDNGYTTIGIPTATNNIDRLYDTLIGGPGSTDYYQWSTMDLINKINSGTSFIHHLGHANSTYMMRMDLSYITDDYFSGVNGIDHNYSLIYTQGCDDGSFDIPNCIASLSLGINNFVVAGVFNTRFGWFDQGTTDGPSEHLQREFVAALYDNQNPENRIGKTQMISKIKTAPWIGLPGEFEPGAQRWAQYDCTLLGDPALWIRTSDIPQGVQVKSMTLNFSIYPNPGHGVLNINLSLPETSDVTLDILDATGQKLGNEHSWKDEASGKHQYSIDLTGLLSGVYYCRMQTNLTSQTKKLIVIR